jgi:hypothetical protein
MKFKFKEFIDECIFSFKLEDTFKQYFFFITTIILLTFLLIGCKMCGFWGNESVIEVGGFDAYIMSLCIILLLLSSFSILFFFQKGYLQLFSIGLFISLLIGSNDYLPVMMFFVDGFFITQVIYQLKKNKNSGGKEG